MFVRIESTRRQIIAQMQLGTDQTYKLQSVTHTNPNPNFGT